MADRLTADRFDKIVAPQRPQPGPRVIWTASAIGARINVSADFVADTLAHLPGSPVKKIGTRYCAIEADLLDFFRA